MKKPEIRKQILNLRKKKFSKNFLIDPNKFLKFLDNENIKSKIIGGYYPYNFEFDILNILKSLEKKKYLISLPKISENNMMNFFQWSVTEPLKINKYGIPEPISNKIVYPKILLIPLVAFDDELNRLGYGGGYYDRYISRFVKNKKIIKVGIGFSFQKFKNLPIDKYDQKLDYIITERDFI